VEKMNYKRLGFISIPIVAAAVAFTILLSGPFSKRDTLVVSAGNLMENIAPQKVEAVDLKEDFLRSTADFSIDLFKQAYTKGENSLVSPTSVFLALGMTANGADSKTLKEFESLLGKHGINMKSLNSYYSNLSRKLTQVESGRVNIANSIWYRDDSSLQIKKDFLQTNADYYSASAYKADFSSEQTVKDINNWVKNSTGNLIEKIIDKIDVTTIMYLINAVYFEDQWKNNYDKASIQKGVFELANGSKKSVDFMHSMESGYIKDDKAQGFIKPYKNGKYSFVALLPDEGVSIDSYIASLSGEKFVSLLKGQTNDKVEASLPKFKAEYSVKLVKPLKQMGLKECFDGSKANFSRMAASNTGEIFIGDILHKTFITVDDKGTKAAAVTTVEVQLTSMPMIYKIDLNRPFVYAIVDNETKLPLFIGTMMNPEF
jgi:serine protease inhibitor